MSQDNGRPGGLFGLLATRWAATESRVNTNENINWQTRVILPAGHAGSAMIASLLCWLGMMGVVYAFEEVTGIDLTANDYLFAGVIGFLVLLIGWAIIKWAIGENVVVGGLLLSLVLVGIVAMFNVLRKDGSTRAMIIAIISACTVIGSLPWAYNQLSYLISPYWPQSPFEKMFGGWMFRQAEEELMNGKPAEQEPEKSILEVHVMENGLPGMQTRILGTDMLGITPENLEVFAAGVLSGRPISESEWNGDTRAFPRGINQFRRARSLMAEAGLIEKINPENPNSSYRLTSPRGETVFKRLAE